MNCKEHDIHRIGYGSASGHKLTHLICQLSQISNIVHTMPFHLVFRKNEPYMCEEAYIYMSSSKRTCVFLDVEHPPFFDHFPSGPFKCLPNRTNLKAQIIARSLQSWALFKAEIFLGRMATKMAKTHPGWQCHPAAAATEQLLAMPGAEY